MIRASFVAALTLVVACQGPPAAVHQVQSVASPVVPLEHDLGPLEAAFDARADRPRVVVLLPARCEACACGLASVHGSILDAYPGDRLHVFVVFVGGETCDACGAPAVFGPDEPRLTHFGDPEGVAARAFARGVLPVAEASEMFLFYPRGARWNDPPAAAPSGAARASGSGGAAPRADQWWHRLGRIAPERHCTAEELDQTLRRSMGLLLCGTASVAQQ